jgi:hypothetical protein
MTFLDIRLGNYDVGLTDEPLVISSWYRLANSGLLYRWT